MTKIDHEGSAERAKMQEQATALLLDGKHARSIRVYQSIIADDEHIPGARLDLACALAASANIEAAKEILATVVPEGLSRNDRSRLRTAEAYIKLRMDRTADVTESLQAATDLNPDFAPPFFSLGRLLLLRAKDPTRAEAYIQRAAQLAPSSPNAQLTLVAFHAEQGHYYQAFQLARSLIPRFLWNGKVWLATASSGLAASPFQGRAILLILAIAIFINYLGPALLVAWLLFAFLGVWKLRHISPRLAAIPPVGAIVIILTFCLRLILLGRAYP